MPEKNILLIENARPWVAGDDDNGGSSCFYDDGEEIGIDTDQEDAISFSTGQVTDNCNYGFSRRWCEDKNLQQYDTFWPG